MSGLTNISNMMKTTTLILLFFSATLIGASSIQSKGSRIIGGQDAYPGQYPYIAAIYTTTSEARYFCGGTLISLEWILTAGHCVAEAESFVIQLGSNTLKGSDPRRVTVTSNTSFLHPDYSDSNLDNDIGLIKLDEPVNEPDIIVPINLPSAPLVVGTITRAVGWGQIDDYTAGPVENLNAVEVVPIDNASCKHTYGDVVTDSIVCIIGNYNEGSCIGDLGGPLVAVDEDGKDVHVAIATFLSNNGCESVDPSGYTRTYSYIDWIRQTTGIN